MHWAAGKTSPRYSKCIWTRLYSAPEYIVGKPATVQGDIYALGVLLYQSVIGALFASTRDWMMSPSMVPTEKTGLPAP